MHDPDLSPPPPPPSSYPTYTPPQKPAAEEAKQDGIPRSKRKTDRHDSSRCFTRRQKRKQADRQVYLVHQHKQTPTQKAKTPNRSPPSARKRRLSAGRQSKNTRVLLPGPSRLATKGHLPRTVHTDQVPEECSTQDPILQYRSALHACILQNTAVVAWKQRPRTCANYTHGLTSTSGRRRS